MYIRRNTLSSFARLLFVNVPQLSSSCLYLPILTVDDNAYPKLYEKIERQGPAERWHFNGNCFARDGRNVYIRRNTVLRYVFLGHVRPCTLPAKSLARLELLVSPHFNVALSF